MTNTLDTTGYTVEKDETTGVITLTPVKKKGERVRKKKGEIYYRVEGNGRTLILQEKPDEIDQDTFDYGNYYDTREQAQAVYDLRRHVYKFPAIYGADKHWLYNMEEWFSTDSSYDYYVYFHDWLPITATEEDRAERARLIKNCYDLLGYVTI